MFKPNDPNTFSQNLILTSGTDILGSLFSRYEVTKYTNVQLKDIASVARKKQQQYLVQCTQRMNIYNPNGTMLKPLKEDDSYTNYPVLINTFIAPTNSNKSVGFDLLDYSPQTVNTKIQSSGTSGSSTGETSGSSNSSTVGSSTSQSNSFGTSVSVGMAGGVSANYDHSSSSSRDHSHTSTTDHSSTRGQSSSDSDGMSIKDWGVYALVNPSTVAPTWTFGQEYPWDAIECRKTNGTISNEQTEIVIPSAMAVRLYDGTCLYPPSQLSMFGVNFVMKALWLVTIPDEIPQEITIQQVVNYFSGSHMLVKDSQGTPKVAVYMDQNPTVLNIDGNATLNTKIDLSLMALQPLGKFRRPAIIGFIPNKFIVQPEPVSTTSSAKPFKINSEADVLAIKDTTNYLESGQVGAGFKCSETALQAIFSENCDSLNITLYFKVVDHLVDYALFLKHWKVGDADIQLTFSFNGDTENTITKYVEALEAEGGEENLLTINMRNQNYADIDYHDYLQMGLNSIEISIKTLAQGSDIPTSGYQIRAISIENS